MKIVLNRDLARRIDSDVISQLGIPGLVLMENAARGVADHLMSQITPDSKILILCGHGNNGGDGFALARQLASRNISSEVLRVSPGKQVAPDAEANLNFLHACQIPVLDYGSDLSSIRRKLQSLDQNDWIVDAMLGTGLRGTPGQPFDRIIPDANESPAKILAVDIPSGLDCNTGDDSEFTIRATITVTFVALKSGFQNPSAADFTGRCAIEPIGLPTSWLTDWYLQHTDN